MQKIFVFGSNEAGRHGAGSAKAAVEKFGAIYGRGTGLQGNSYAIATKSKTLQVLSLSEIKAHVDIFLEFAQQHQEMQFHLVAIGCGRAGYSPEQIAPMFQNAPDNCQLPKEFQEVLENK